MVIMIIMVRKIIWIILRTLVVKKNYLAVFVHKKSHTVHWHWQCCLLNVKIHHHWLNFRENMKTSVRKHFYWCGGWMRESARDNINADHNFHFWQHKFVLPEFITNSDTRSNFELLHAILRATRIDKCTSFREAPARLASPLFGHCPNSDYTPPRTQTGTLGHFFSGPIWANLPNHRFDGT